jgi:S-adenosyl-L-methionine hydrolase (adenosine-forming)
VIITLTTDFWLSDAFVGAMKGVILGINPRARIVDISHDIPPQDIDHAAFVVQCAAPFFPKGTVHTVVVDPGVGTERLILAVRTPDHLFLAPNNGVLKHVFAGHPEAEVFNVTESGYFRGRVSRTFHGRDIFAPVAAHLSRGLSPGKLGRPFTEYDKGIVPRAVRMADRIRGEVIAFDRFGNGITNIPAGWIGDPDTARVLVGDFEFDSLARSYLDVPPGEPLAIIGSADALELSVNRGSARETLELKIGDTVTLIFT